MKREPTFTVEAIYPHKVVGYHKVWIHVDQSLHVQLQFNGHPVPLPAWFTKGRNATLTRFSQLNNFPNAIRVVSEETECSRSLLNEMLDISNYQAKGRPPYSSAMIRFALYFIAIL